MISFKWRHFKKDIILMLVRWYVAYPLSYRHIEELAAERGLKVDHSTVNRWVIKYSPLLESKFTKNNKRQVGKSWRMDETYLKIKGEDVYLYRAVDKSGDTVDFMLSKKRDRKAAFRFLSRAIGNNGVPDKVTIDGSAASKLGLNLLNIILMFGSVFSGRWFHFLLRQIKYLNNIVEQDHRFIKKITKPMLGFKAWESAKATLAGIELHHMLRKGQHESSNDLPVWEQFYALAN